MDEIGGIFFWFLWIMDLLHFPFKIKFTTPFSTVPILFCTANNLCSDSPGTIPSLAGRYDNPIWRTGPPDYIDWRNRFLWIDSWAP
jgi:hypothetical protein